jgi:hypothetical protein
MRIYSPAEVTKHLVTIAKVTGVVDAKKDESMLGTTRRSTLVVVHGICRQLLRSGVNEPR